jgi:hypothetical protein
VAVGVLGRVLGLVRDRRGVRLGVGDDARDRRPRPALPHPGRRLQQHGVRPDVDHGRVEPGRRHDLLPGGEPLLDELELALLPPGPGKDQDQRQEEEKREDERFHG